MIIQLSKSWDWSSGVVYDNEFRINDYEVNITFDLLNDKNGEGAIALERIEWWFSSVMQDAVMMEYEHSLYVNYLQTEQRIILLPNVPLDNMVSSMLFFKLTAIVENRLAIASFSLSSKANDWLVYTILPTEDTLSTKVDTWWVNPAPICCNTHITSSGNVIPLGKTVQWHELGLGWVQDDNDGDDNDKQVVKFKNEPK